MRFPAARDAAARSSRSMAGSTQNNLERDAARKRRPVCGGRALSDHSLLEQRRCHGEFVEGVAADRSRRPLTDCPPAESFTGYAASWEELAKRLAGWEHMSLSPQFLDELRSRTLLSALIGRTTLSCKRPAANSAPAARSTTRRAQASTSTTTRASTTASAAARMATPSASRCAARPAVPRGGGGARPRGRAWTCPSPTRAREHARPVKRLYDANEAAAEWFAAQLARPRAARRSTI